MTPQAVEAARQSRDVPIVRNQRLTHARTVAADYFELTKPRVQTLLLWTTITTMLVAGASIGDSPSVWLIFLTCLGGALSAGSAGALNHYIDRDIDLQMERTARRPIPAGRISPRAGLIWGISLGIASEIVLIAGVNLLAGVLALCGLLGYVVVYTIWLKRRTPQNIVIGGAAGAVPPLVGWVAVTGSLNLTAWLLFAIVFMWTPPHFWALAIMIRDEYAASAVPMLSVVRGVESTAKHIFVYTLLLVATTLIPVATGAFGALYGAVAVVLGGVFIRYAVLLLKSGERKSAVSTYLYSMLYLAILFVAMAVDAII